MIIPFADRCLFANRSGGIIHTAVFKVVLVSLLHFYDEFFSVCQFAIYIKYSFTLIVTFA